MSITIFLGNISRKKIKLKNNKKNYNVNIVKFIMNGVSYKSVSFEKETVKDKTEFALILEGKAILQKKGYVIDDTEKPKIKEHPNQIEIIFRCIRKDDFKKYKEFLQDI